MCVFIKLRNPFTHLIFFPIGKKRASSSSADDYKLHVAPHSVPIGSCSHYHCPIGGKVKIEEFRKFEGMQFRVY